MKLQVELLKEQVELLKDRMTEKERVLERLLAEKDLIEAKTNEILGWKNRELFRCKGIFNVRSVLECAGAPSQGHQRRKPSNDYIDDCRPIQHLNLRKSLSNSIHCCGGNTEKSKDHQKGKGWRGARQPV